MQTLKISLLVFILSITAFAQWEGLNPFLNENKLINQSNANNLFNIKPQHPTPLIKYSIKGNEISNYSLPFIFQESNHSNYFKSNSSEWITLVGGNTHSFCFESELVWIANNGGGLVQYNRTTGEIFYYNEATSDIPTNRVWALVIDGFGNKWIGTWDSGLLKFDGNSWTIFDVSNSGLPSNSVTCIEIDNNDNLWLGTSGGLVKFDGNNWMVYNTSNSGIPSNDVWSLMIDEMNVKWVGTWNDGLAKFNDTTWIVYNSSNSPLIDNGIMTLAEDNSGDIWIGTYHFGIYKFDGIEWVWYYTGNSDLPDDDIYSFVVDKDNIKWVGTVGGGLAKFNDTTWTVYNTFNSEIPGDIVYGLEIDSTDNKWLGIYSSYGSLPTAIFDENNWTSIKTTNNGLANYYISSVAIEDTFTRWISTPPFGITKFEGNTWSVIDKQNSGLPDSIISKIVIDRFGNKWIGTIEGGLVKFDGNTWTVYNTSNSGLPSDCVLAIAIDSLNNKWIGTVSGMAKFDDTTWTVYNTSNSGLPSDIILSLEIQNNIKWIGTPSGGLVKYNDIDWISYFTFTYACGMMPDFFSIVQDNEMNIWVAAYGCGIGKYDGSSWTIYTPGNSGLVEEWIRTITIDCLGNVWAGGGYFNGFFFDGQGLSKFDNENWSVFTSDNSALPNNSILSLAIDSYNNKWIGTRWGLGIYNEGGVVPVKEEKINLPSTSSLSQNYPNPFNPVTKIKYSIPQSPLLGGDGGGGLVTLKIYDILGREIATLVNEEKPAGEYEVEFNGATLPSGIYFYQLKVGEFSETKKMVLLR